MISNNFTWFVYLFLCGNRILWRWRCDSECWKRAHNTNNQNSGDCMRPWNRTHTMQMRHQVIPHAADIVFGVRNTRNTMQKRFQAIDWMEWRARKRQMLHKNESSAAPNEQKTKRNFAGRTNDNKKAQQEEEEKQKQPCVVCTIIKTHWSNGPIEVFCSRIGEHKIKLCSLSHRTRECVLKAKISQSSFHSYRKIGGIKFGEKQNRRKNKKYNKIGTSL